MPTAERPTDRHATLRDAVLARVLDGPGETEPTLRHAAAVGRDLPADLQPLVDQTVQRHGPVAVAVAVDTVGDCVVCIKRLNWGSSSPASVSGSES